MDSAEPAGRRWIVKTVMSAAVIVLVLSAVAWLTGRAIRPYQAVNESLQCRRNIHMLVRGWNLYADDYDGRYPSATTWETSSEPYVPTKYRRCPALAGDVRGSGYGAEAASCGRERAKLENEDTTPLVFDCVEVGRNVSAGLSDMPRPGRHVARFGEDRRLRRGNWVGYAGGGSRLVPDAPTDE